MMTAWSIIPGLEGVQSWVHRRAVLIWLIVGFTIIPESETSDWLSKTALRVFIVMTAAIQKSERVWNLTLNPISFHPTTSKPLPPPHLASQSRIHCGLCVLKGCGSCWSTHLSPAESTRERESRSYIRRGRLVNSVITHLTCFSILWNSARSPLYLWQNALASAHVRRTEMSNKGK